MHYNYILKNILVLIKKSLIYIIFVKFIKIKNLPPPKILAIVPPVNVNGKIMGINVNPRIFEALDFIFYTLLMVYFDESNPPFITPLIVPFKNQAISEKYLNFSWNFKDKLLKESKVK